MIQSINLIQSALAFSEDLTKADWAVIKALPFIGIGVVLSGLAILAIVLSQFYRLAGKDAKPASDGGHKFGGKHAVAPAPAPEKKEDAPVTAESELEQIAAMIGLSIYMTKSSDKIYLTETKQYYNNNPWTSESLAKQSRRFKRWQAVKK
ncbi:MAG: OadG family protein [Lachnospiraceae bacterium]|nr:OadG family protein [Lachnospiraceae bacterium]